VIADSGTHVALCPTSDTQPGIFDAGPPVDAARLARVQPRRCVDVECALSTDMFAQMQATYTIQRMTAYRGRYLGNNRERAARHRTGASSTSRPGVADSTLRRMTRSPVTPVDVAHGWIDYLTAWSTVAAALLALAAIVYAVREAKRSDIRVRRERQLYYELGLLQRLSEIIPAEDRSAVLRRQIIGILSALPGRDLPMLRALVHVRAPDGAEAELGRLAAQFGHEHPSSAGTDQLQLQWNALAYTDADAEPKWSQEVNAAIRARLDRL
jgi:hypothetical protein